MPKKIPPAWLIAGLSLLTVLTIDFLTPLGVATGTLYVASFFFVTKQPVKVIVTFAVVTIIFITLKLLFFFDQETSWMVVVNRIISVFAIIIVSFFAVRYRRLREKKDEQHRIYVDVLKEKNRKLRMYRDALNVSMIVALTDVKGTVIYTNEPYCSISGYSRRELIGSTLPLINPAISESGDIFEKLNMGLVWRGEIKSISSDGQVFWTDTVVIPIQNERNTTSEFFILGMPVTQRKLLEAKQAENLRAFEVILWNVQHKLRSPISSCMGLTILLEKELNSNMSELHRRAIAHRKECTSQLDRFSKEITELINKHSSKFSANPSLPEL
jgi:PAS domain S-box-containing protein